MVPAGMESQPLLGTHRAQQDTRFWVCVRRTLLILFWAAYITVVVFAVVLVIQAYHPPPPSAWHQRRVICRNTGPQQTGVTARIQAASVLGCGGLILSQDEVGEPGVKALVEEAQRYGVRTVLEVPLLEKYSRQQVQRLKDTARSWLQDGVSAFWLSGERRTTIMMMSQILQDEAKVVSTEDRLILFPEWMCDDDNLPQNKSFLLRTCPLPGWNPAQVTEGSHRENVAWEVVSDDPDAPQLRKFLAATLPGTIIVSLNQSLAPPFWLRSLLLLRFQNPALYAGWLQVKSNGSSYSAVSHLGCSTLLIIIGHSDQSYNMSLLETHFSSARLLLSTRREHNRGQVLQEGVRLQPGEAQLLRLIPL